MMKRMDTLHPVQKGILVIAIFVLCAGGISWAEEQTALTDPQTPPFEPEYTQVIDTEPAIVKDNSPVNAQDLSGKVIYSDAYQIGPGDILSFDVYLSPDLSEPKIRVGEDGRASFRGIGEIDVQGMTIPELQARLTDKLSKIIRQPMITVGIVETKPGIVYLVGAFKNPGMYEFSTRKEGNGEPLVRARMNLSNVLANAGGVKMEADLSHVEIRRADGSDSRMVDYWAILRSGLSSDDLVLRDGDTVTIPSLSEEAGPMTASLDEDAYALLLNSPIGPKTIPVRVSGEIKNPGLYELEGTSPFLNSALTKAGGLEETSNKTRLEIRRNVGNGRLTSLFVDPSKMDITLRPNDQVIVSPKKLALVGAHGTMIRDILSPLSQITGPIFSTLFFFK
ncbi:MAG: polysaccharide biosynthesis/export family protein [Candidatus Melainabacteria bacterium]